jgi:hypothetical protein
MTTKTLNRAAVQKHLEHWNNFKSKILDAEALHEEQQMAMYRAGWAGHWHTVDEFRALLWKWQIDRMNENTTGEENQ